MRTTTCMAIVLSILLCGSFADVRPAFARKPQRPSPTRAEKRTPPGHAKSKARGPEKQQTQITVQPLTPSTVYITSSRDLSNVEFRYYDGSRQRFEDLRGRRLQLTGTGAHAGKPIATVWVKSGANFSGDGPGLGQRFDLTASRTRPSSRPLPRSANGS